MATQELLQGTVATPEEIVEKIDSVTTEDVARVARELLQREKLRLAVVGPSRSDKAFQKILLG